MTIHIEIWVVWLVAACLLLAVVMVWRLAVMPVRTAFRGMELISSQDLNSRLVKVGEPYSDKIVKLFNTLIDRLHNERLHILERESFLNLLVEASPVGIAILDFDGRFSLANPAYLKISGVEQWEILSGKKPEECDNIMIRRMASLKEEETEVFSTGDRMMWRVSRQYFYEKGFKKEFFLVEVLTEEIRKAEKEAYGKVIRAISHEVNNTLGGIRSVLGLMSGLSDEEEIVRVLESCDNRCARLSEFIGGYADVVRIPEPVLRECDLGEVVLGTFPFLQSLAHPGVSVEIEPITGKIPVKVDESLMEQVLVNVIRNASDSIEGLGKVRIRVSEEDARALITVSDNGTPIPAEIQEQLFTPFFSTKPEGKGIGLTLTAEILRKHKASFSLKTDSDGWTRFTIILPLHRH